MIFVPFLPKLFFDVISYHPLKFGLAATFLEVFNFQNWKLMNFEHFLKLQGFIVAWPINSSQSQFDQRQANKYIVF